MCEKDVIIFLLFSIAGFIGWIVYLLSRVCDLKEDVRVAKAMSDYYKKKVTELEAKMHDMAERVREQVDGY